MKKKVYSSHYHLIIVGAGGTGLAAGMYAARLGLKTLVLGATYGSELAIGGVITTTNIVENYPGFKKLTGQELAKRIEEHAREYENVEIKNEKVEEVIKKKDKFTIKTKNKSYTSNTILFATGTKWKELKVKGSSEFRNKGINYCAICDGALFKNKVVAVVGGSDSAAKDALLLTQYAKKVYMIYRGKKIRPEPVNLERIEKNKKVEVINNTNIIEIKGDKFVTSVILDKLYKGKKELTLNGIFIAIGHIALSDLAKTIGVRVNKKEEIKIDHIDSSTNLKGVFAAGDVTNKPFKQLIIGVADGCTAAYSAYEYLLKKKKL